MSEHTPEDADALVRWWIKVDKHGCFVIGWTDETGMYWPVANLFLGPDSELGWRTARLIASAPDLLDRLTFLVEAVERGEILEHHVRSSKAAIAKATSRSRNRRHK